VDEEGVKEGNEEGSEENGEEGRQAARAKGGLTGAPDQPRPRGVSRRGHHQAARRRVLRSGGGVADARAGRTPDIAAALPGRDRGTMFLSEEAHRQYRN